MEGRLIRRLGVSHDSFRRMSGGGEDRPYAAWCDAMKRQAHNIVVSTLEASDTMLEEADPDSDPEESRIELMEAASNAATAMGGGTKEKFMEMGKEAAEQYLNGDDEDDA